MSRRKGDPDYSSDDCRICVKPYWTVHHKTVGKSLDERLAHLLAPNYRSRVFRNYPSIPNILTDA